MVTYVGLAATTRANPGQLLLLSFRRVVKLWDVSREIISVGTAETGRDPLPVVARRFFETLAGSQVAWCVAPPTLDSQESVAVAQVKLSSRLGTSSIGEVVAAIAPYFPGTELFRVSAVGAATGAAERDAEVVKEVGKAAKEDAEIDKREEEEGPLDKVLRTLKKIGVWLLVVVAAAVLLFAWRKSR